MKEALTKKAKELTNVVLKAVPLGERVLDFADLVTEAGKGYTISKIYDLGGESVRLPHGVVLTFKSGGGLRNGIIIGDGGIIHADSRIFYDVEVRGSWACRGNVLWWTDGCRMSETEAGVPYISRFVDDQKGLQAALDSTFSELVFPPRLYYTTKTLLLWNEKRLTLEGARLGNSLMNHPKAMLSAAVVFTDKDICVLRIAAGGLTGHQSVSVVGGNFDVSICKSYTSSVIEVRSDQNERVWGLHLATAIRGDYGNRTGVGIDINPVENRQSAGYITEVRIDSTVVSFGTGIRVRDYHDEQMTYFNWCSDVTIDGSVINCPVCVDGTADMDIRAMLQAGWFFPTKDNGVPLIRYGGLRATVASNIYDIRMENSQGCSNEYALEVTRPDAMVTASGHFRTYAAQCERLGWPITKGKIII